MGLHRFAQIVTAGSSARKIARRGRRRPRATRRPWWPLPIERRGCVIAAISRQRKLVGVCKPICMLRRLGPALAAGGALGLAAYRRPPSAPVGGHLLRRRARGERPQHGGPLWFPPRRGARRHRVRQGARAASSSRWPRAATSRPGATGTTIFTVEGAGRAAAHEIGLLAPTDRTDADAEDPYHADPPWTGARPTSRGRTTPRRTGRC